MISSLKVFLFELFLQVFLSLMIKGTPWFPIFLNLVSYTFGHKFIKNPLLCSTPPFILIIHCPYSPTVVVEV